MKTGFLKKIKTSIVNSAQTSTFKIEEVARTGKLHINIISERRKLAQARELLGEKAFAAIQDDVLHTLHSQPEMSSLLEKIKTSLCKIDELESILADKELASAS